MFTLCEKGGLDVINFNSVDEAINLGSEIRPDIILLNAEIDGLSAEELLGKLRKFDQIMGVPAVLFTNRQLPENFLKNNTYGVIDVLRKHTLGKDLLIRLHELWGEQSE